MAASTLTLNLSDKTLKKLRALAMLSGSTVDQLEKEFADYFDQMLSENIATILAELDGREYIRQEDPVKIAEPQETVHTDEEEGNAPQHDLSEDDLPEEVKSLAETVEAEFQPQKIKVPNAGEDAESFLDAAMASERRPETSQSINIGGVTGNLRPAGKGFNPNRPRASVAEFTGDN